MIRCWIRSCGCRSIEVAIHDDAAQFVRETAAERRENVYETIRHALAAYRYLLRVKAEDGRVIITRADGTLENPLL